MIADAHNKGRHVDKDVRQALPEALLDHLRDPDRNIQDAGHHGGRLLACKHDFSPGQQQVGVI